MCIRDRCLLNHYSNAIKFTSTKEGEHGEKGTVGRIFLSVTGRVVEEGLNVPTATHPAGMPFPAADESQEGPLRLSPRGKHTDGHLAGLSSPKRSATRRWQLDFECSDTGIGISSTQLATLFVSFAQVAHSSGEYGGTGQASS